MMNLIKAGFTRLRKNKLFWILSIFSIGLALFMIYTWYGNMKKYGDIVEVEQLIFNYSILVGIVIAIFTSLFLGVEYSDGAMRNKISIGHKRINIYLSNLIIVICTSIFSYLLFSSIIILIGIPLFGKIVIPISMFLWNIFGIIMILLTYSSVFTFLVMTISNKTITAIVSILFAFGLMMYSLISYDRLLQPEYIDSLIIRNDTDERVIEPTKNPHYLTGQKKKIVKFSLDINPAGQALQIADRTSDIKIFPVYSSVVIIIFTSLGLVVFKRKELK